MIRSIEWSDQGVVMIDQRLLPNEERYNTYTSVEEIAEAIRAMVIRGAPAIGVATAMGIAMGVRNLTSKDQLETEFQQMCDLLQTTRPTARNLSWAIERMTAVLEANREQPLEIIKRKFELESQRIHAEDIELNRRLGQYGQQLLGERSTVLTHCNTGSLATAGYGTALGVIRAAVENGKALHVFADETRPFLQGARLTAWEMAKEKIPCTLITDNMSGFFMQSGRIDAVVVGADRIARNGDTANKIGTYPLAVVAKEHQVPFYIAAQLSTIDLDTVTGRGIPIEHRDTREVTEINGKSVAPSGIKAENPAFDVTPHRLIAAIITEEGIAREPYQESLLQLLRKDGND